MPASFGRQLLNASPHDAVNLEREARRSEAFEPLDRVIGHVIRRSLAGDRVAELTRTRALGHRLHLSGLTQADQDWAVRERSREAVQARGFWSLPEKASLQIGPLSTAWSLRERGLFGPKVSTDERARLTLDDPEAVLTWSALLPVAEFLYRPVYLRTVEAGESTRDVQIAEWAAITDTLEALGLGDLPAFEAIRYGGGWSRLRVDERHQALLDYCAALRDGLPDDVGSRLRHRLARPLIEKYYARAHKDGTALQKRVVTAALQPAFVGIWGGDWTAFVGYLGESVHPQEHVATALPEIDLAAPPTADLDAVASATGTTTDDVAAVAAAVFGADALADTDGPDRIDVLRQFWDVFDAAHARQRSGETSLWGLVDSGSLGPTPDDSGVYGHDLYRERLPQGLVTDIETLWGGHLWTRNPERTVTEWSPHARMAEAFGPALTFWEGVALTAWFICEGPYSRTDFPGLPEYHAREIAALDGAGTPVDPAFLTAIGEAERLLGPPQEVWHDVAPSETIGPITVTFRTGGGTRRDGFEKVRDLITTARRAWADRYLEDYLKARKTEALEKAAERYHVLVNARGGKTPTLKQAAKEAASATNLWLGGDLGAFFRQIREKSPVPIENGRRVTRSPDVALADLYGRFVSLGTSDDSDPAWPAKRLLKPATEYVRWLEATGEAPDRERIKDLPYYETLLGSDSDLAWSTFVGAIEQACLTPPDEIRTSPAVTSYSEEKSEPTPPASPSRSGQAQAAHVPEPAPPSKPWWRKLLG